MIVGLFRDEHPRVTVKLIGTGTSLDISFIVDTGFAGDIKVSPSTVAKLGLEFICPQVRRLADGQEVSYSLHTAVIDWSGGPREVEVLAMDGDDLIGTGLIRDMLLQVEGVEHGEVTIEPL